MSSRKEIRARDYVTSADGAVYRVWEVVREYDAETSRYRDTYCARLDPFDPPGGGEVQLPLTELRRVPDPSRQRPPITGMPEERPACAYCAEGLKPSIQNHYAPGKHFGRILRRTFERWRGYPYSAPLFCTNTCAMRFAVAAYRGGSRMVRRPAAPKGIKANTD